MSDDFGRMLRDGTAQFGAGLNPAEAHLVRARSDQRRKRKATGVLAIALAIVVGSGAAYAFGHPGRPARPASPATAVPAPGPTATHTRAAVPDKTLRLGQLILRVPETWRVTYSDAQGDYTVSTGACAGDDLIGAAGGSACAAFSLITDAVGQHGGMPPYAPGVRPYTSSTGTTGCPGRSSSWVRSSPLKPYHSGYAAVTSTRTADYTVWQFGCEGAGPASAPIFYFQQRDWYLPGSDILIVDEYSTPGLAQILATATWK
jgi:hypothetical protein